MASCLAATTNTDTKRPTQIRAGDEHPDSENDLGLHENKNEHPDQAAQAQRLTHPTAPRTRPQAPAVGPTSIEIREKVCRHSQTGINETSCEPIFLIYNFQPTGRSALINSELNRPIINAQIAPDTPSAAADALPWAALQSHGDESARGEEAARRGQAPRYRPRDADPQGQRCSFRCEAL